MHFGATTLPPAQTHDAVWLSHLQLVPIVHWSCHGLMDIFRACLARNPMCMQTKPATVRKKKMLSSYNDSIYVY